MFLCLVQPLIFVEHPDDPGPRPYACVLSEGLQNNPMVGATLVQRPNYTCETSYGWSAYPYTW